SVGAILGADSCLACGLRGRHRGRPTRPGAVRHRPAVLRAGRRRSRGGLRGGGLDRRRPGLSAGVLGRAGRYRSRGGAVTTGRPFFQCRAMTTLLTALALASTLTADLPDWSRVRHLRNGDEVTVTADTPPQGLVTYPFATVVRA